MTRRQSNVTSANQLLYLSMTSFTCNSRVNKCRSWVYEPRRSKIGSYKEIVGECKYNRIASLIKFEFWYGYRDGISLYWYR